MNTFHARALSVSLIVFAVVAIAASRTHILALNSSPSVNVTRLAGVSNQVWPGDFNGDGITDLATTAAVAAGAAGARVRILLGSGGGKFAAPIDTTFDGHVVAVGDVNGDGKLDVIAVPDPRGPMAVLPGNGDGTLGAARAIEQLGDVSFAAVVDMNGDGKKDLVVVDEDDDAVDIYSGNGDFTFGPKVQFRTGLAPNGGVVADLNGDGRADVVVANHNSNSLTVFMNKGAFMFTPSDIAFDRRMTAVTAGDVNGDGKVDLVAAGATPASGTFFEQEYVDGFAYVLTGKGDGTFDPAVAYQMARGAFTVVVGDFTRDGIVDIATGNRSTIFVDDCGPPKKTWDSVSILPGLGGGRFGASSWFSVGNQRLVDDPRYRNTLSSLATADVNGDGATDLVVSEGVLFTSKPMDPNWPPKVTATSTQPAAGDKHITLRAIADDVDQDMLTYSWNDSGGTPIPPIPRPCFAPDTLGVHTFTVTVEDRDGNRASSSVTVDFGNGGGGEDHTIHISAPAAGEVVTTGQPYTIKWTAASAMADETLLFFISTDGGKTSTHIWECDYTEVRAGQCVWQNPGPASENAIISLFTRDADFDGSGSTGPFSLRTPAGAPPWPWLDSDIGAVGAKGGAGFDNGGFTVRGSGADIWGTADEFNYLYQHVPGDGSGDVDFVTRVDSVQNVDAWTKAGLMVRFGLTADAPHASIFVTPGKGVSFQRRLTKGAASLSTTYSLLAAPAWLRLSVRGSAVLGYYKRNEADAWTLLDEQRFDSGGVGPPYAGLAVTSHADGTVATATFSDVSLRPVPLNWRVSLVGSTIGSADLSDWPNSFPITNRGVDIWGTSDQFTFINTTFHGDGELSAWIRTIENTSVWAKAGVMFRATLAPNSPHVSVFVTPGNGIAMQYRPTAGAPSADVAVVAGSVPVLLKLTRKGNTFTGEWSPDATTWHTVGTVTVDLGGDTLAGIPFTSHNATATATATGAGVNLSRR